MNIVYYSFIKDFKNDFLEVKDKNRNTYLTTIKDVKRRYQSYAVWKLLEYFENHNFNRNFNYTCIDNKWQAENKEFYFSIAHSENCIALAISDKEEIGIDVEIVSDKILKVEKFLEKKGFFLDKTKNKLSFLTKKWTEIESSYKANNNGLPCFKKVFCDKMPYFICVTANDCVMFEKVNYKQFL